jgi:hypothetical protein
MLPLSFQEEASFHFSSSSSSGSRDDEICAF